MKKALLLPLLAGLALCGGNAEAAPKEKPAKVRTVDTDRDGNSILRRRLSLDTKYSTMQVNGIQFERGIALGLDADVNFNLTKWLNLRTTLDFNYEQMSLGTKEATEKRSLMNLSLEGRTNLYTNDALRMQLGLGARYHMENNDLDLSGTKGNANFHLVGPMMGLSIESRYLDFYIDGSVLLGSKRTSYDRDRDVYMLRTDITFIPRYSIFSLPTTLSAYQSAKTEKIVDRKNYRVKLELRPTFRITKNLDLFLNFEYLYHTGTDDYQLYRAGGGATLRF